ncbi:IucA/IucC family protein, partial [Actinomadura adrarensis]
MSDEGSFAARVLHALLREDYAGLRRFIDGQALVLPERHIALVKADGPGFMSEWVVDARQGLRLDDLFGMVRGVSDPRDDVEAFERECREAWETVRLHEASQTDVLGRLARVPEQSRLGPGTFYESLAAYTDHPVHPMGRCRVGLDAEELRRYAPEFAPSFRMRWARVASDCVTRHGVLPDWWPGEGLFPVHPLTASHLEGAELLPEPCVDVAPTLSMRTVAVDGATHLKVPLPTSTLGLRNKRTIVPRTLPDGALAERLLRHVLEEQPELPVLLADEQTYGHADSPWLAYLVRRYPPETARAHIVPVAALLAPFPGGGCVAEQWDVPSLFGSYLDALLAWNVVLFRRGIALEAHQQNVSLVLDDSGHGPCPSPRLLIKDYDGTLFLGENSFAFAEGTFVDPRMVTQDPEALARVFTTITLHLCAAAPAFGLAERGLLPLRTGLAMIRDRLDA